MDFAVHSADISQQCRPFEVVKEWVFLLFEEFFRQGDIEKEMELPVSMLCDRDTTKVAGSQPGFIGFVVMPLFQTLTPFIPELNSPGDCIETLKSNKEKWSKYEETEDDIKIYEIGPLNSIMSEVKGAYKHEVSAS